MLKVQSLLVSRTFLNISRPTLWKNYILRQQLRNESTHIERPSKRRDVLYVVSGGIFLALGIPSFYLSQIHADTTPEPKRVVSDEPNDLTLGALIRSYAVFTMCSIPSLVDNSPRLLELASIPGIKWFAEAFVRITFFDHFVGGDTVQKAVPLLRRLRAANKGTLLAYSVEVDEAEAMVTSSNSKPKEGQPHKQIVDEMIRCVDAAADFEDDLTGKLHTVRRTWVAVKISALLSDASALVKLSSHLLATRPSSQFQVTFPGCPHSSDLDVLYNPPPLLRKDSDALSNTEIASLRELHADLIRICTRAQERGVKIIFDAEYSWYQPAIDALTLSLTRQFNKLPSLQNRNATKVQPLIYGTYQAYLQRTPAQLSQSLADAKAGNYALGVKLVRGAYHSHELSAYKASVAHEPCLFISPDPHPPVWTNKAETDACYNTCVQMLVEAIEKDVLPSRQKGALSTPAVGVLFGTHNWDSCNLILNELLKRGLVFRKTNDDPILLPDDVTERVAIGQLYGMADDLTNYLVKKTTSNAPLIIKYVPFGALSEVMPYLSRRAIENKSILGNGIAAKERRRAGEEIRKKLFRIGTW